MVLCGGLHIVLRKALSELKKGADGLPKPLVDGRKEPGVIPLPIGWPGRAFWNVRRLRKRCEGFGTEVWSRVVYEAGQAASFLMPSSNVTPWTTSARSVAPLRARQRFWAETASL